MRSEARTVAEYLAALPEDRREAIATLSMEECVRRAKEIHGKKQGRG